MRSNADPEHIVTTWRPRQHNSDQTSQTDATQKQIHCPNTRDAQVRQEEIQTTTHDDTVDAARLKVEQLKNNKKVIYEKQLRENIRHCNGIQIVHDERPPDRLLLDEQTDDIDTIIQNTDVLSAPAYNPPHTPISYRDKLNTIWPFTVSSEWAKNPDYKKLYDAVRRTALPNYIGARRPVVSGLKIQAWRTLLHDYHDKQLLDFLEFGWPADFTADLPPIPATDNHKESQDYKTHIKKYIQTELEHGALLGPFDRMPFQPWTQISPLMTRPKRNTDQRRVIVDLSYPGAASVNAGIKRAQYQGQPYTYTLPNILNLADEVTRLGRACYMWSADLARAYRQLRTCPLSTPLFGITLEGKYYLDAAPPLGAARHPWHARGQPGQ